MIGSRVLKGTLLALGIVSAAASVASAQTISGPSTGNTIVKKISNKFGLKAPKNSFGLHFQLFPALDEKGQHSKCSTFIYLPLVQNAIDAQGQVKDPDLRAKYEEVLANTRKILTVSGVQPTRHKKTCTVTSVALASNNDSASGFDIDAVMRGVIYTKGASCTRASSRIDPARNYLVVSLSDVKSTHDAARTCQHVIWVNSPSAGPNGQPVLEYYQSLHNRDLKLSNVQALKEPYFCLAEKIEVVSAGHSFASATASTGGKVAKAIREIGHPSLEHTAVHGTIKDVQGSKIRLMGRLNLPKAMCIGMLPSNYKSLSGKSLANWTEEVLPMTGKHVRFTNVRQEGRRDCVYDTVTLSQPPILDRDTIPVASQSVPTGGVISGKLVNAKYIAKTVQKNGVVVFLTDQSGKKLIYKGCDRFWLNSDLQLNVSSAKQMMFMYGKKPSVTLSGLSVGKDNLGLQSCFFKTVN
ncbi:MAG: hypothetical protein MI743_18845 [Sneathiellales bacterium]|nr:hypothetical protein [Sneathiellales bacterium]